MNRRPNWLRYHLTKQNRDKEAEALAYIGVDIGGTAMKAAIVSKGIISHKMSAPTKQGQIMEQLIQMIEALYSDEISGIGIATAGIVDVRTGVVIGATDNLQNWKGTNVKKELEGRFLLPVAVDNDANAAARAESLYGAAKGFRNVVCITLGTGVGAGIIAEGQLLSGGAGEVGHMVLHPNGRACNCGKAGCLEQYVSGSAIRRSIDASPVLSAADINPEALFAIAASGQEEDAAIKAEAKKIVKAFIEDLYLGLCNIHAVLDPALFLLGGGLIHSSGYWMEAFHEYMEEQGFVLPVKPAHFLNDAGIIGAAAAIDHYMKQERSS